MSVATSSGPGGAGGSSAGPGEPLPPPAGGPGAGGPGPGAAALKPLMRGWLHLATFPLAVAVGLTFSLLVDSRRAALSMAIFTVSAALLFGVSALYHRGSWSVRTRAVLRRFDHANIFLMIAGTYTPFAVLLLHGTREAVLLWMVWGGALVGVAFRVLWLGAPRWMYVPCYIAVGWAAAFFIPSFFPRGGGAVVTLIVAGGVCYSLGALVYGLKRPKLSARVFGFHEVFHSLTVLGFAAHVVAIGLAAARVGALA